jgi:hypothetical protein
LESLEVPAADSARVAGGMREFVDCLERFVLGKIKQLSKGWTH